MKKKNNKIPSKKLSQPVVAEFWRDPNFDQLPQPPEYIMKEEIEKIWESLRSFAQETRDEIDKIKSENETFMRLNRMYNEAMNNNRHFGGDVKKIVQDLQNKIISVIFINY